MAARNFLPIVALVLAIYLAGVSADAIDLPLEQNQTGAVKSREWVYYRLNVNNSLTLQVMLHELTNGDADLYVQQNVYPTRDNYLARNISTSLDVSVNLTANSTGEFYVGVYGFLATRYIINATTNSSNHTSPNSNTTSPNSNTTSPITCVYGNRVNDTHCTCDQGYAGQNCSATVLQFGEALYGKNRTGNWNYYAVNTTVHDFEIKVLGLSARVDTDVYVKRGALPSRSQYDYANVGLEREERVFVQGEPGEYYVGVYLYQGGEYRIEAALPAAK